MSVFYKGMDLSFVPRGTDEGMQIKDFDGTVMEPLALAKKYGVNSVRLRLWNQPENVPESKGYCNTEQTIAMAKEIKKYGMSFMLDFHYSDYWADPGNQTKPLAWKELHGEMLEEAVYAFTRDVLLQLDNAGALPDIVQIGNEIRSGLLFPDGELPDYKGMTSLVNAGIRAARSVADSDRLKIMIHLDQGGRYRFLKDWFDHAFDAGLMDFDLIGLSYYPFWHGTFMDLKETTLRLIKDFHKPIMVVETAHAWRKSKKGFIDDAQEKIAGVPATPQGQKQVVEMVMHIIASLPDEMGQGVYYWEPLCVPDGNGGWNESMGILDEDGTVLEAVKAFMFTKEESCFKRYARIYEPKAVTCLQGTKPELPRQVMVLCYDGTAEMHDVKWEEPQEEWYQQAGTYIIEGTLLNNTYATSVTVNIVGNITEETNLVVNPQWHDGLAGWNIEKSGDEVKVSLDGHILDIDSSKNFRCTVSQTVELKEAGIYRLKVSYRGVDTTNVDVRMFMQTKSQYQDCVIHPTDDGWTEYELEYVKCDAGQLTFGIRIVAPPVYGRMCGFRLEKMQ